MKKWYDWDMKVIKTIDFIKNTFIIYGAFSIIAWDINIGHWWNFGRVLFIICMGINLLISYGD